MPENSPGGASEPPASPQPDAAQGGFFGGACPYPSPCPDCRTWCGHEPEPAPPSAGDAELMEQLADAEHASWARWMAYLFSRCRPGPGGTLHISVDDVVHWQRQIDTPYADLTERERESDRQEVRHILPFIEAAAQRQHAAEREQDRAALEAARAEAARLKEAVAPELIEATEYWRLALRKQEQGYGILAMYYAAEAERHAGRVLAAVAATTPAATPAEQEEP